MPKTNERSTTPPSFDPVTPAPCEEPHASGIAQATLTAREVKIARIIEEPSIKV